MDEGAVVSVASGKMQRRGLRLLVNLPSASVYEVSLRWPKPAFDDRKSKGDDDDDYGVEVVEKHTNSDSFVGDAASGQYEEVVQRLRTDICASVNALGFDERTGTMSQVHILSLHMVLSSFDCLISLSLSFSKK